MTVLHFTTGQPSCCSGLPQSIHFVEYSNTWCLTHRSNLLKFMYGSASLTKCVVNWTMNRNVDRRPLGAEQRSRNSNSLRARQFGDRNPVEEETFFSLMSYILGETTQCTHTVTSNSLDSIYYSLLLHVSAIRYGHFQATTNSMHC
jgi:hypothetical protein